MLLSVLPNPESFVAIGWIVVALAAVAVIAEKIEGFFERRKEKPAPAETYATKVEMQQLREDVLQLGRQLSQFTDKLVATERALAEASEQRGRRHHQRMEEIQAEMGERLHDLEKGLRDMPSQIITLLKNTGAIS